MRSGKINLQTLTKLNLITKQLKPGTKKQYLKPAKLILPLSLVGFIINTYEQ